MLGFLILNRLCDVAMKKEAGKATSTNPPPNCQKHQQSLMNEFSLILRQQLPAQNGVWFISFRHFVPIYED